MEQREINLSLPIKHMKYCPKCKSEYRDGFNACSDCNIELVDAIPYEQDRKSRLGLFKSDKPLIAAIINGILLFFAINLLGEGLKGPFKAIMPNINMSSPINMSSLFAIPMGIIGAIAISLLSFWFIDKHYYLLSSLISALVGFCIDIFFKSGGPIGFLFLIFKKSQYFVFMIVAFLTVYTIAFITMLVSLKIMNKVFPKRNTL